VPKDFRLPAHEIAPIVQGRGGCIASDRITVDGMPVGYMYRSAPVNEVDSGWAFLAGDEDQAYLDDPDLHGVYDVNTIANYDRGIVPFVDLPIGARVVRGEDGLFYGLEEPEYERVDPQTAAYIERGGAEGWENRRPAMTKAMWILMGIVALGCGAVLLLALS
jgi:hypothetical protein